MGKFIKNGNRLINTDYVAIMSVERITDIGWCIEVRGDHIDTLHYGRLGLGAFNSPDDGQEKAEALLELVKNFLADPNRSVFDIHEAIEFQINAE